jgi:hypothetical protein
MTESSEIITIPPSSEMTLFGTSDPEVVVDRASKCATALARIIEAKVLYTPIGGRKHIRVEGWTLLGTMLGVFPVCVWSRRIEGGWEARVEARTRDGAVVGAAEAQCRDDERNWRDRDDFALRSMAQTRATSKALRLPLGFIMAISGYDATPAEEMDSAEPAEYSGPQQARPSVRMPKRKEEAAPAAVAKPAEPVTTAPVAVEAKTPMAKVAPVQQGDIGQWVGAVVKITARPQVGAKGPYTLYKVYGGAGEEFSTFSDTHAEEARYVKENGLNLAIEYSTNKYGRKIENCVRSS